MWLTLGSEAWLQFAPYNPFTGARHGLTITGELALQIDEASQKLRIDWLTMPMSTFSTKTLLYDELGGCERVMVDGIKNWRDFEWRGIHPMVQSGSADEAVKEDYRGPKNSYKKLGPMRLKEMRLMTLSFRRFLRTVGTYLLDLNLDPSARDMKLYSFDGGVDVELIPIPPAQLEGVNVGTLKYPSQPDSLDPTVGEWVRKWIQATVW
ncbi:hypothetical protein HK104_001159 [Borealophlyctis nickersoniae]|nr:hypothetical protein HK104_001159 [Borealophlyctis nickersoniae]